MNLSLKKSRQNVLAQIKTWGRINSPWAIHFNSGGCNGCDIEILATLTPRYDVERFGIKLQGSPRHADVLICTGPVTRQARDRLLRIYEQMPNPKFVIAVGPCAISGGVFQGSYNCLDGIDKVLPVDVYIPGCPPRPEAIIDGVIKLLEKLRLTRLETGNGHQPTIAENEEPMGKRLLEKLRLTRPETGNGQQPTTKDEEPMGKHSAAILDPALDEASLHEASLHETSCNEVLKARETRGAR